MKYFSIVDESGEILTASLPTGTSLAETISEGLALLGWVEVDEETFTALTPTALPHRPEDKK